MDNAHIGKFRLAFLTGLVLAGTAACSKPAEENGTAGAETSAETPAPAPAAAPDTYAALAADAGQVEAGKKLFSNCAVCHSVDPATPSPAGPQLIAVVGRQIGGAALMLDAVGVVVYGALGNECQHGLIISGVERPHEGAGDF